MPIILAINTDYILIKSYKIELRQYPNMYPDYDHRPG